jgi:hypothetical protein
MLGGWNMQYLTGEHALNINCNLLTSGDWHQSALKWESLTMRDSNDSPFGDWGIEPVKVIPKHEDLFNVANHIRALLDLVAEGNFAVAQGMKEDFICNDDYTDIIFEKVWILRNLNRWNEIDVFMSKEYDKEWINYTNRMNK